jgi:hypothetical protein
MRIFTTCSLGDIAVTGEAYQSARWSDGDNWNTGNGNHIMPVCEDGKLFVH